MNIKWKIILHLICFILLFVNPTVAFLSLIAIQIFIYFVDKRQKKKEELEN
jgi:hypothetical protein